MAHIEQQEYCESVKKKFPSFFKGVFVLDIGSLDINGNNQNLFEDSQYIGVDVALGRNVDILSKGHELTLPDSTFDVVISTECFEHDQYYSLTLKNIYRMLKPGGLFLFTCATTGRKEHGTKSTTPEDAPLLQNFSDWSDYYQNLTEDSIRQIWDIDDLFKDYDFSVNHVTHDLYFYGVKKGDRLIRDNYSFLVSKDQYKKDIEAIRFFQEGLVDSLSKENLILINESIKSKKENLILINQSIESKNENESLKKITESLEENNVKLRNEYLFLSDENSKKNQELNKLKDEIAELNVALNAMRASNSWKISSPLRCVSQFYNKAKTLLRIKKIKRFLLLLIRNPLLPIRAYSYYKMYGLQKTKKHFLGAIGDNIPSSSIVLDSINLRDYTEVNILTVKHCSFVAELIRSNLKKINLNAKIIYSMPDKGFDNNIHFVICPQMFDILPSTYIAFQMEQSVSSRWFNSDYIDILENSYAIFDYSESNISFLLNNGLYYQQIYYMPISFCDLDSYAERDYKYDVIFYGDVNNERRRKFITALSENFNVKVINDLFGDDLYQEILKAKVVVNIHYYEGALLETTRLYECLSLGKIIVSESSSDIASHPELQNIVDFVAVNDIDGMIERVAYWVDNENSINEKVERNLKHLKEQPNWFEYYFMRFMLANDWMSFDEFYDIAGRNIQFNSDFICLGLPESVERHYEFEKDNSYNIQYFPGLRHKLGWVGCGLSYKFLMKKAKEQCLEFITICEDDVEFKDDFYIRYSLIIDYLKTVNDWDVFSGLIADLHNDTQVLSVETIGEEKIVYIDKMTSMVLNVYSNRFYDTMVLWDDRNHNADVNTIDRYIEGSEHCNVVTTSDFLVGHKEDLDSTLWGFKNSTYASMIKDSSNFLNKKIVEFINANK